MSDTLCECLGADCPVGHGETPCNRHYAEPASGEPFLNLCVYCRDGEAPPAPPLSMKPKTVRSRLRREEAATPLPKLITRMGEAFDAIARRMGGMFNALGGQFVPASRKARWCARCGKEAWEHRKGGKAWTKSDKHTPVSIAPSLLQLGRVAKVYPNAVLTQDGSVWTVREPLTGFVRGRGNSRRAALRAALRGGSRRAS